MTNVKIKYLGEISSLIFLCFLLLLGEGLARVLSPPLSRLERILAILEQDPDLFWKQRAHMNTVFEGAPVKTNGLGLRNKEIYPKTNKDTLRIVCLGASPTWGWGVKEEETYATQLEHLLKNAFPSRNVEVINAGVIGYSSYQGLHFLKNKIIPMAPAIITVPYVINDVDKHRFFRSTGKTDKELGSRSKILTTIENFLDRSRLINLLKRVSLRFQSAAVRYFGTDGKYQYIETRRVPIEDYKNNLKSIIDIAQQNDIKVILLKMPVNLPAKKGASETARLQAEANITTAIALGNAKEFDQAIAKLQLAIIQHPFSSKAYYLLGKYHELLGASKQAQDNFQQAIKMELYECGYLGKSYNKIMENVAREGHVVLVDIVAAFHGYTQENHISLFLDEQNDTIHPNPLGHSIISREIYAAIVNNTLIKNKQFPKVIE